MTGHEAWDILKNEIELRNEEKLSEAFLIGFIALHDYDDNHAKFCKNCVNWCLIDEKDKEGWCKVTCGWWKPCEYCSSFERRRNGRT